MKTTIDKCENCGALFEDEQKYQKHIKKHNTIIAINGAFPPVKDKNCVFANGGWNVQRSEKWLTDYKQAIEEAVNNKDYPAFSYGWYRCLDDGGDMLYGIAGRVMNICRECYREWGQPYYAHHCNHQDKPQSPKAEVIK
jgi:ribosome-binding protein aMBF1 (putative translation factor)